MHSRNSGASRLAIAITATLTAASSVAQTAPATEQKLEAVVVTGSRIAQSEFNAPTPVVSVSAEAIELSGSTNLTDYLTSQPALVGSSTSGSMSGSEGFIGSSGLNLLDLRNLGRERTLVLVDGRRHVAQLPDTAAVDINTIPQDLIERIDVVTGGVSAIYGADAVSGAVNFVMKRDFEGLVGRFQYGAGAENRKPQDWLASLVWGDNLADGRANITFALEHRSDGRLHSTDRRQFTREHYTLMATSPFDPSDDPRVPDDIPIADLRYFDSSRGGAIDLDGDVFPELNFDGSPFERPLIIDPFYSAGGSGTHLADYIGDLISRNNSTIANVFFNWSLSDSTQFFVEGKYVYGKGRSLSQPTFDFRIAISEDNPFIPATVRAQIDPALGEIYMNRDNFDLGVRADEVSRDTYRTVVGVKGEVLQNYRYEVSYVFGQTLVNNVAINNRYNDRFAAAVDVVTNPATGQPVCRSNLVSSSAGSPISFTPGPQSGCQPLNLFGEGSPSPQAIDWVMLDSATRSRITQNVVTAFVGGPVPGFTLPGGPIDFIVGAEWRSESSTSDPPDEDELGITFGNVLRPSHGEFDVGEVFAEVLIPIVKDVPGLELLQINSAIRQSDYTTVGSTTTWNLGATWKLVESVGLRGMYAESIRAPNIAELFSPEGQDFAFIDDPCDALNLNNGSAFRAANCAELLTPLGIDPTIYADPNSASIAGLVTGNATLLEETAQSYTFGIVLTPSFLDALAISIDYYDIKLAGAISTATAQELANNCVDQPSLQNVFCAALTRDVTTGGIDSFLLRPENVTQFRTRGIDAALRYSIALTDDGRIGITLVGNNLDRLTFIPTPGAEEVDQRGAEGAPERQGTVDLTWERAALTVNYGFNYYSRTKRYTLAELRGDPDLAAEDELEYDSRRTHDLTLAYQFNPHFRGQIGVTNLLDQKPDYSNLYPVSPVGRFFFAGFKASLNPE